MKDIFNHFIHHVYGEGDSDADSDSANGDQDVEKMKDKCNSAKSMNLLDKEGKKAIGSVSLEYRVMPRGSTRPSHFDDHNRASQNSETRIQE